MTRRVKGGQRALLLDAANNFFSARERGGVPDFHAILAEAVQERAWIGTAVVPLDADHQRRGFVDYLTRAGFRVAPWETLVVEGRVKGDADVLVAVEGMRQLANPLVTELVFMSGDSEMRPLGEEALRLGKAFTVAAFRDSLAPSLRQLATRVVLLGGAHVRRSSH